MLIVWIQFKLSCRTFFFQMLSLINILIFCSISSSLSKVTYCKHWICSSIENDFFRLVNLENTYGPYCNPNNKFTPDAGIIRYAGFVKIIIHSRPWPCIRCRTPWLGKCVLNLESCCLPMFPNGSLIPNLAISTTFYLHLVIPPLCSTENVTIQTGSGQSVIVHSSTYITILGDYF